MKMDTASSKLHFDKYLLCQILFIAIATATIILSLFANAIGTGFTNKEIQESLIKEVKLVLPDDWIITGTRANMIPSDWNSFNRNGFLVEAEHDKDFVKIWFLPIDWIGIRKIPNNRPRTCYWEGILVGNKYKVIALTSPEKLQNCFRNLFGRTMRTPCLVNGGFDRAMQIFDHNTNKVDNISQELIAQYCKMPTEFAEAAYSLVVLGIPAKKVFLKAAQEVHTPNQDFLTGSLGLIGTSDAIKTLCDIVADAKIDDVRRGYTAQALDKNDDARVGPALKIAVEQVKDTEALGKILHALTRTRYNGACETVLNVFKNNISVKLEAAQTLAALHCRQAIPDIKLLKDNFSIFFAQYTRPMNPGYAFRAYPRLLYNNLELDYLRLTADWGKPGQQIRAFIIPPKNAISGSKIALTACVENIGNKPFTQPGYLSAADLRIDGKPCEYYYGNSNVISYDVYPGEFALFKGYQHFTPGKHIIEFEGQGCRAKPINLEVLPQTRSATGRSTISSDDTWEDCQDDFLVRIYNLK